MFPPLSFKHFKFQAILTKTILGKDFHHKGISTYSKLQ